MRALVIIGPTAVGKTALGVALAQRLGGEVVSADSRQVYRGLDLGTGKVTKSEMDGIPHHLIDVTEPQNQYTVHEYVTEARKVMLGISARGKLPIVVGGTGLYVDALLGRIPLDAPPGDQELRNELESLDLNALQKKLLETDPERYAKTDIQNPRRVIRAIEVALAKHPATLLPKQDFDLVWIGLTAERESLKKRIHERLASRLSTGMLDEARALHEAGLSYERMESLGLEYRYMARHLTGALSYEEMVAQLESEIYKYAKRQMTWFKRNKDIQWFDADSPTTQVEKVKEILYSFISRR